MTELPDTKYIPENSKSLGNNEKTQDLGLSLFVKSAEHPCGGKLIGNILTTFLKRVWIVNLIIVGELIAKEGFSRLKDDGTLLKARAFDRKIVYFGICPDFMSFPEMKRAKAISQLRESRKKGKMFVVHRISTGWGMTLVVQKK